MFKRKKKKKNRLFKKKSRNKASITWLEKKEEADLCNSKEMVGKYKLLVKNAKRAYNTWPKEFKT